MADAKILPQILPEKEDTPVNANVSRVVMDAIRDRSLALLRF